MIGSALDEQQLLEQASQQLRGLLGEGWDIAPEAASRLPDLEIVDAIWGLRRSEGEASYGEILVEAKRHLTPAAAANLTARQLASLRLLSGQTVVVVAPWLSPRTREVLEERGFGYLDLTGNILLRLDRPAIFIKTQGADENPSPEPPGRRGFTGPRAARLVRQLVDFREPRRASELAAATDLSEGYVSRLLDSMSDEALIGRSKDRLITKVDWRGLLRARAASYQLMRANHVAPAIARKGSARLLETLRQDGGEVLATGSIAAHAFAPTAVGGALMLYVPPGPHTIDQVARDLSLLRIDQAADADVLLLQPMSSGAMERPYPERIDGIRCVGLSQLVLDCLSGPGRMPAEGEAVLEWMVEHEDEWRQPSPLKRRGSAVR